jgi:endonuclease III
MSPASPKEQRTPAIVAELKRLYPDAKSALHFSSALELLVATILAAQCTDERVNQVTETLFRKYPTAAAYANADLAELEQDVKSTGFYRNKAKNIQAMARILVEKHGGEPPRTMAELVALPGVARKTANVVLGNAYHIADGIAVDTHVLRLSARLGLTESDDPVKVEQDLMRLMPKDDWVLFSHLIQAHGRQVCLARRPLCERCGLLELCPTGQANMATAAYAAASIGKAKAKK